MANLHRGEIDAELDGKTYRLCLTLGALAELEQATGTGDILALVARITSGKLSSRDCIAIIGAGLRASGHDIKDDAVARMQAKGGATGAVDIVARLLAATFGPSTPSPQSSDHEKGPSQSPFPGAR